MKSNKKIFIFEDIDCMSEIIHKRDKLSTNKKLLEQSIPTPPIINIVEDKLKINMSSINNNKDKLTLNTLLNLLDGILEDDGRILIMTTNHPDKLDPALTRPGRIDFNLDMNNCSLETIIDIVNFNYNKKFTKDTFPNLSKIDEFKWSPAEMIQLSVKYKNTDDLIHYLTTNNPMVY